MLLHLQKYDYRVVHRTGKEIPVADAPSRSYLPEMDTKPDEELEAQVHSVIANLPIADKTPTSEVRNTEGPSVTETDGND